jgi:la-related protein 1
MASTFSYAQAAKGIATTATTNKPASGSATPAKDGTAAASATSWAEDVETDSQPDQSTTTREPRPQTSPSNAARVSRSVDTSSVSSPDLGTSSSSTVTKDDDVSSIPNTSSESTWDNKSQASTSVDKTTEPVEKTSEKVKKGKNAVVKPLREAPPPAINPWKIRADEVKGKVNDTSVTNGAPQMSTKKSESGAKGKPVSVDSRNKGQDEVAHGRKDVRGDIDARKGLKGRFSEKDARTGSSILPPPPHRDQESWPTPETVIDEDRKKAQEKGEKTDKDRKDGGPTGKHEWVKVPYTPSVVFNTPLPNAANARRGGRPGGRGGAQSGGRPTGSISNGAGQPEKDGSAPEFANVEQTKSERHDGAGAHDSSSKEQRTGSAASPTLNGQAPVINGDAPSKATGVTASETDTQPGRASETSHAPGHSNAYPRQYPNRPSKGRRGDFSGAGERRRNGEVSPPKDSTLDERRVSAGTQTETAGDADRQGSAFQESTNGHHSKQGRFGSFSSGRERGGRGRGARTSYSNGHQFANGHQPMHSTTFSMGPQSPTTFNPGNSSFFTASQGKYGRNGHRSQSVATADAYRYPPYQNGPSGAPLQTYNMYDYGVMQPMSPMPFGYGVDYAALVAMITTQVYVCHHYAGLLLLTLL